MFYKITLKFTYKSTFRLRYIPHDNPFQNRDNVAVY
eukprot:COSAG02_NODE_66028_length_256_cov_0.987261_1_plen_35_part_10